MTLRDSLNSLAGRWAAQQAARREYGRRTLLIANHWDGSVQQYYHFRLGYLFPVASWIQRNPGQLVTLRDCGPMNVWLRALQEQVDLEIIPPGDALHRVVGNRMKSVVLQGLDDPDRFNRRDLRTGAMSLASILRIPPRDPSPLNSSARERDAVIIDRQSSEDFYHSSESETHMSGRERRSTPNLSGADWRDLTGLHPRIVDLAHVHPPNQIQMMQNCNLLIGQHGAGLLNMVWMAPGSSVIEVEPPLPPEVQGLFPRLAACLGHRYSSVPQRSAHSDVDLEALGAAVREMTGGG